MGVLNFSTDNLITGVNIIDGNLYWTDNLNEPKKLEIDMFRDYDHSTLSTNIRGEQFNESDITVIRMHPWKPITLELEEYNPTDAERLLKPNPPFEKMDGVLEKIVEDGARAILIAPDWRHRK